MALDDWSDIASPAPLETENWSDIASPVGGAAVGGFTASAKQAIGQSIKGVGQLAQDYLGASSENPLTRYGQSVVDANPTAVHDLGGIVENPLTTVKEAAGNAVGSMGGMLATRLVGQGITAAAPLTGPAAPLVAGAGQLISWAGPAIAAALPSYSGIREAQIKDDPSRTDDAVSKALALGGAGAVGVIESKFGPQEWALSAMTKAGRDKLAKKFGEEFATSIPGAIGKGMLRGAAVEGAEELAQNPIEQLASYQDPRTPENIQETLFGGAMGAIGGGVLGGGMGPVGMKYAEYQRKLEEARKNAPTVAPTEQPAPENPMLALPAPTYTGTPGDQIVLGDAERQAAIDAADKNAAALYAERDQFEREAFMRRMEQEGVVFTANPAPLQDQIDAMLAVGNAPMNDKARKQYEKDLASAFNEQIGVRHGPGQIEVPFTMGEYLDTQVTVSDMQRARQDQIRTSANDQAATRLAQVADEETSQPAVPVVGPISAAANVAIQNGAAAPVNPLAGMTAAAPVSQAAAPNEAPAQTATTAPAGSEAIDLTGRNEQQLTWLTTHGKPGFKEAAIAELARRGITATAEAPTATAAPETADTVALTAAKLRRREDPRTTDPRVDPVLAKEVYLEDFARNNPEAAKKIAETMRAEADRLSEVTGSPPDTIRANASIIEKQLALANKPEATPGQSAPQQTTGAENGQTQTEVLTKASGEANSMRASPYTPTADYAAIDEGFRLNREAMNGLKVGDTVSWVAKGTYTQKDGTKVVDPVRTGKITAVQDKEQGIFQIDGNISHGARFLTKQETTETETAPPQSSGSGFVLRNPKNGKLHKDAITGKVITYPTKQEAEDAADRWLRLNPFPPNMSNEVPVRPVVEPENKKGAEPQRKLPKRLVDWTDEEIQARLDRGNLSPDSEQNLRAELDKRKGKSAPTKMDSNQQSALDATEEQTGLSIGKAPNGASPITVKGGVVHVDGYPALDYETGDEITVPAGATGQDIAEALRKGGNVIGGVKIFGLTKEAAPDKTTDPKKPTDGGHEENKSPAKNEENSNSAGGSTELTKENFDARLSAAKGNLAALVELNKELGKIYGSGKSKENPGSILASQKTSWAKDAMPKVFSAIREINGKGRSEESSQTSQQGADQTTTPSTFESFKNRLLVFGKVENWHGASFVLKQRPNGAYLVEATYPDFNTVYGANNLNYSKAEAAADAASRAIEWWKQEQKAEPAPEAPKKQAPTIDARAVAKQTKAFEHDLHVTVRADAGLIELAGTSSLDEFTAGAEASIKARVDELRKDAETPEAKAALDALIVDGKPVLPKQFFESAYKAAKTDWENKQKEAARDPELYRETLSWGLGVAKIEEGSEDAAKYKTGFDHALRGQTRSTLPNDSDIYLKGYNDARAWVKTDDGRAWFEGKRIEKQKNTGVVLKRWWERIKKDIDAISETTEKGWEALLKSTARSELFPMSVVAEDATPGAKEIMEKLRAAVSTFQEYFYWEGANGTTWRTSQYSSNPKNLFLGKSSAYRGRMSENVVLDDAQRLAVSKDIAKEYQDKMKAFAEAFSGVKSIEDIEKVVDKLFYPDGRLDENGKLKPWNKSEFYNQNAGLFVANASKIKETLPLFDPDDWDAKYKAWTKAKNTEVFDRPERDRKESLLRPRLDKIIRSGLPNERGQRNISSDEFKKTFGFADVVIGQYVTGQQAQDHLNYAYDALMTMAGLLGAKPKQLSFGGSLYFTIGALGHGKYAAHFSPNHPVEINGKETTVPVINVTATRGDGSVLHEFFHAIDFLTKDASLRNTIAGVKKLLVKTPGDPESVVGIAEDFLSGRRFMTWGGRKDKGSAREQALYALNSYFGHDSKRANTSFYSEALALDKGSTKPYWSNDVEPFARMAEAWGLDTLTNSNKRDDYLVSDWAADGKVKRPTFRGAPYPMAKERERLVKLFQRLADSIEWTDEGPVLKADSPWLTADPWKEANRPYLDALKATADNIDAVDAQRKEREAQKKIDAEKAKLAAIFGEEKTPEPAAPPAAGQAPEADNVGLSEDELSAIFDEESDKLREETQERPKAEAPGEKTLAPKTRWTQEDLRFVLDMLEKGTMVLVADGGESGIPTIHDMPNGNHIGMGVFTTGGAGWSANFTAGGSMYSTPGGMSYTTLSVSDGSVPASVYDIAEVKAKINGKLLAKSGPRAAPTLSSEQEKTAGQLAKEMAKYGVKGIDEALAGLVAIFGGGPGKLQSFPGGFDEESYKAAKPHFLAAAEAFGKAGMAFKDFVRVFFRSLIQQFGDGVKPYAIRFAKDYEAEFMGKQQPEQPKTDEASTEYVTESASRKVAEWVRDQINDGERFDWRALFAKADEFFGGTQANGVYTPKDAYDAMELGINLYLLDAKQAYPMEGDARLARRVIEKLDTDILNLVATQTKRTAEQDEFQQFSTPPTYAYLANWVANLNSTDSYLEPSAGIGGLALFGKNAGVREVVVNELSDRRLGVLRNMPFDRYFSENAEQLNNILPAEIQPTVIVMNPPFSATAGRSFGQRDTMNGAKHIEQALKRLNSGGRLVAIVGEGMAADRPAFRDWWKKIMAEYNVRANVGIEGTGYVKYGTTFDNQILVIDKNGPTNETVVTGKVKSPADALNLLENVRATRPVAAQNQEANGVDQQPAGQPAGGGTTQDGSLTSTGNDARPARPSGMDSQRGAEPGRGRGERGNDAANGNDAGAERPLGGRRGESNQSGQSGRGNAARTDGAGNAAERSGSNEPTVDAVKVGSAENAESASGEISNSVFEQYQPKKVRIEGAIPHNTPLVESAALASVVPPDPTYAPKLDKNIIKKGLLSDAQLEAVVYAGQAHQQMLNDGKTRRGFFLGDGTGVGKGRQISGVILDNWNQGRKKAIWISKKKELIKDAKRDFGDLGGDPSLLVDLGKKKIGEAIGAEQGILFAGYPTIRGQTKAAREAVRANKGQRKQNDDGISYERIQQIVDWVGKDFDGALIFDEAHEMGNAVPIKGKRGPTKPSDQALAALELQRALPKARVMYVSATGATEVSNLAYAERLGIWGDGTPFSTVLNFVAEMSRSVSSMELVAQNLKQMGLYLARSLSYDGVQYERLEHTLTDYQRETYDKLAGAWQVVLQNIGDALETTGVMSNGKSNGRESGKIKSNIMSAFWGAHQRFFNQIITASQMPSVIKQMEKDIADGKSIVLQVTNTNEADQTRALAKLAGQKVGEEEDVDSLEELDLTPRDQLIQLVTRAFPVAQYESYTDEDGKEGIRLVKDSNGQPVINREALAKREALIEELRHYEVPDSPLQMIIDVFGTENVAEITGRTQRVVTDKDGKRKVEKRSSANVDADAEAFKDNKKHILIFSQAGGTGFSFHSDRRYKNQAQRVHYVLQPGWSADKAVQGFGRSHRTNQVSAPIYRLITTDIPAQKRFISSIARRLEQLGALTAGQRDTAGGSMFSAMDNLESKYATMAVRQFFEAMRPGMGIAEMPPDLLDQMGLSGIYDENGAIVDGKVPPVTQFLNRLLSLKLDAQQAAFDFFMRNMEAQIDLARRIGTFDDGMQTIRHKGAATENEQVVYTDPMTGAPTKYYEIQYKVENPIYKFSTANATIAASKQGGWFKNNHSGRVAGVWTTNQVRTDKEGRIHKLYGIWRTSGTTYENVDAFRPDSWTKLTEDEGRAIWETENAERPTTVPRRLHMVVGGILPIWDRFNNEHVSVVRLSLDDGRRLLGRQVMDKDVADTMNRLNVQSAAAKMSGEELIRAVMAGSTVEMSNRLKLKLVTVSGQKRVEIDRGNRWFDYKDENNLRDAGVINERIEYKQRHFIPADPKTGGKVLDDIMRVMAMNPVSVANGEQDGDVPATSRTPAAGGNANHINVAVARDAVKTLFAGWRNAPNTNVVATTADLPAVVLDELAQQGENTARGVFHNGTFYLVADQHTSPADVEETIFHEVWGHYGLRSMYGARTTRELADVFDRISASGYMGLSGKDAFRAFARRHGFESAQTEAMLRKGELTDPRFTEAMKKRIMVEELVSLVQEGGKPGLKRIVQEWLGKLRAWLRKNGFGRLMSYSDSDLMYLVKQARDTVTYGQNGKGSGNTPVVIRAAAQPAPVAGNWDAAEPSKMDDVIYALQDKHIDTKRVLQSIMATGKNIADDFNAYLQEELFHGRAAKGVKDFLDFELRPFLKEMDAAGVDMGDFEEYLWNRHAEERNVQIAKINPDMPDGGSGINTADARAYLAGLSADQKTTFERLAKRIDAINRKSRQVLVDSGLESQETIDKWNGAYKKYVPLQREDVDSGYVGTGKGFSIRGSASKRAMGSGRKVVDIIANIAMQRERNIVRAEKNRVSNALMGLAIDNPNSDFWKVDQAPKERVVNNVAIYNVLDSSGNKVSDFTNMDEADRAARAIGGSVEQTWGDRVQERIEPGFKNRDNVILTRVNGKDHYIIFNERDERAMRMAMALKNLDADGLGRVLSLVGKATRYLASINTQYNPVFGVINLIRDVQGALINLSSTPLAGEQKRVLGYTKDALVGIYKDIRAHRAGRTPSSNWAALFEEFQKEGGQTGYRDAYANAEARAEAIKSELEQFKEGKAKQLTRGIFGWLSDYNETMENAVRLASYKVAREKGMSKAQAASLAKNLTVNFNRKGQMATQVGALYAFFNASVQGTARIGATLFDIQPDGSYKLSKTGKRIIVGGIMLGSMQALLLAAAGYDDDEPPDFVRERNLILPAGWVLGEGKYLTLAMPLGFHVIPGIGRIATEFVLSGGKDPIKKMAQFASMFAEAFNPVGNSGFTLQTITPSVVDPLAALAENKDFTGKEIYREDFNKLNPTTGLDRAKDTATIWSKYISSALNFITGGNEYRPGLFSPSPDAIDYLIGQATGGVGREIGKLSQTGGALMTGEELPLHKVPLFGRFVGDTQGRTGQSEKFYNAIREVNLLEAEFKGLIGDGRREEAMQFRADHPAVNLMLMGNAAENQVRKLRNMKQKLIEEGADRSQVRGIEDRISEVMRRFNERAVPLI